MNILPSCDVLVVGAGLAGTQAALAAAGGGCSVCIASAGRTFSGSSFSAATWGFGLVGPFDDADADDLERAILDAGQAMADPELVKVLVEGIPAAVARLEGYGCALRRPTPGRERERDYIPCFDTRVRSWHGIGRKDYAASTGRELDRLGARRLEGFELLDVAESDGQARAGIFWDGRHGELAAIPCGAIVLATGGLGGLYARSFEPRDVAGTAQAIALEHGGALVNAEFVQLMCAMEAPVPGVIFNERTFRYARFAEAGQDDAAGGALPAGAAGNRGGARALQGSGGALADAELLRMRSAHGPMTARLADRAIDLAIAGFGPEGASMRYDLPAELPDFIQTYFDWFSGTYGGSLEDTIRIRHYAHASNGGILIDRHARCMGAPAGLYAAGECTGGMHGADRIGGLASASALVFGNIAGREAARFARKASCHATPSAAAIASALPWLGDACHERPDAAIRKLGAIMDRCCLVSRTDAGLRSALDFLDGLAHGPCKAAMSEHDIASSRRLRLKLFSARALATSMLARPESRGAHYRADAPDADPQLAAPRQVALGEDGRPVSRPIARG